MKDMRVGASGSVVLSVMRALADRNCSTCHDDIEEHLDLTQPELYRWPPSRNKLAVTRDQCYTNTKYYPHGETVFFCHSHLHFSLETHTEYIIAILSWTHRDVDHCGKGYLEVKRLCSPCWSSLILSVFQTNIHAVVVYLGYVCMEIPMLPLNELGSELEAM